MRVGRLMAAGVGLGACGGFVAGLLRPHPDAPWVGWHPGEPPRYEPVASARSVASTSGLENGHGAADGDAEGSMDAAAGRTVVVRPAGAGRAETRRPGQ